MWIGAIQGVSQCDEGLLAAEEGGCQCVRQRLRQVLIAALLVSSPTGRLAWTGRGHHAMTGALSIRDCETEQEVFQAAPGKRGMSSLSPGVATNWSGSRRCMAWFTRRTKVSALRIWPGLLRSSNKTKA